MVRALDLIGRSLFPHRRRGFQHARTLSRFDCDYLTHGCERSLAAALGSAAPLNEPGGDSRCVPKSSIRTDASS